MSRSEALHRYLMVALHRSGRQADALEAYRRARTAFIEHLGIEPSRELASLERAILSEEGRPIEPAPAQGAVPRQLPTDIADFTGREPELAGVLRFLSPLPRLARAVRVVSIAGRGGVGKSALAVRAAHICAERFPDGQIYACLRGTTPDEVCGRLLRAVGVADDAVPTDPRVRVELYRSTLAGRRMLIVLDDVADESQVAHLLPGSPTCAVITTSRRRLSALPGACRVDLDAFEIGQALSLLREVIGDERVDAEPVAVLALARVCAGLPLALRVVAARLVARPHWRLAHLAELLDDPRVRLDELAHGTMDLRACLAESHRDLSPLGARLFSLLSMVEQTSCTTWMAAALLDTDLVVAENVIEALVDAQLLTAIEEDGGLRYRFCDLVRVYAGERLLEVPEAEREAASGRLLGSWLALTEAAHRRVYGSDHVAAHGVASRGPLSSAVKARLVADPLGWLDSERSGLLAAVRQAFDLGFDEVCWDLAITATTLFEIRCRFDDWASVVAIGRAAASRSDDRRGVAAMRFAEGTLQLVRRDLSAAGENLMTAMESFRALGDKHGSALAITNLATIDGMRDDDQAMLAKCAVAVDALRSTGDPAGLASVLYHQAKARLEEGDPVLALTLLDEALGLCRRARYLRGEAQVLYRRGEIRLRSGDLAAARGDLQRALGIVDECGDAVGQAHVLHQLGLVRAREGDPGAGETLDRALLLARSVGDLLVEGSVLATLGELASSAGARGVAEKQLVLARSVFDGLGAVVRLARVELILARLYRSSDQVGAERRTRFAERLLATVDSSASVRLRIEMARGQYA